MLTSGRRTLPVLLTLALALAAGTVLLFSSGPDMENARSIRVAWDNGHIVYFALFTVLLLRVPSVARLSWQYQWLLVAGITVLTGSLIEILQLFMQRDAELGDVVRDLAGALLVLAFAHGSSAAVHGPWRTGVRIVTVLFCLSLLQPLLRSLFDEVAARLQFPLLADFETPFEIERWSLLPGLAVTRSPGTGNADHALEIPLSTATYSGVELKYFPGDWHDFRFLHVELFNAGDTPLRIACRIHDLAHTRTGQPLEDRYNQRFLLDPGWNTLDIDLRVVADAPRHRHMDMKQIRGIGFFVVHLPAPRLLYLDNLRLSQERQPGPGSYLQALAPPYGRSTTPR